MSSTEMKNHPAFKKAIEEAKKSTHEQQIGAVIFKGKRIVSSAFNEVRGNNVPKNFKNFLESFHAECSAIIKARKNLKGYSIIVVRINPSGKLLLAKPCILCTEFIKFHEMKEMFYSTSNDEIVREKC